MNVYVFVCARKCMHSDRCNSNWTQKKFQWAVSQARILDISQASRFNWHFEFRSLCILFLFVFQSENCISRCHYAELCRKIQALEIGLTSRPNGQLNFQFSESLVLLFPLYFTIFPSIEKTNRIRWKSSDE